MSGGLLHQFSGDLYDTTDRSSINSDVVSDDIRWLKAEVCNLMNHGIVVVIIIIQAADVVIQVADVNIFN